ncbi:MAG: hypothetical protein Fur0046_38300 [Cyanobacteria bacterium J069]
MGGSGETGGGEFVVDALTAKAAACGDGAAVFTDCTALGAVGVAETTAAGAVFVMGVIDLGKRGVGSPTNSNTPVRQRQNSSAD